MNFRRFFHFSLYLLLAGAVYLKMGEEGGELPPSPIALVNAPDAIDQRINGEGVCVAVIDEGFDLTHHSLRNQFSLYKHQTQDSLHGAFEPMFFGKNGYQFESHGTHVSGIILDFAPKAEIIPIQLEEIGGGDQIFVRALRTATFSPARVVNISMRLSRTGREISPNVKEALISLGQSGKLIILAAGNEGAPLQEYAYTDSLVKLANDPRMGGRLLLAGASTYKNGDEKRASFSNYPGHDSQNLAQSHFITAPGDNIMSTITGGSFGKKSGTSMAAPIIAGAACLLGQAYPHLPAESIAKLLLQSARQESIKGAHLSQAEFGAGILNIKSALEKGQAL